MTRTTLIQWLLWAVVTIPVLAWLNKGRVRGQPIPPARFWARQLIFIALLVVLAAILYMWGDRTTMWPPVINFGALVLLLLWAVGMFVVSHRPNKSHFSRPASKARRLVQPISTFIAGLIGFVFFAALAVTSSMSSSDPAPWWATTGFVAFALWSLSFVYLYLLEEQEISDEGLSYRSFIGRRKSLRWSELCAVRYARTTKWFRLETGSGTVARISVMLMGLPEFAQLLLQRAPAGSIESTTLNVLRDTAAGKPPRGWI